MLSGSPLPLAWKSPFSAVGRECETVGGWLRCRGQVEGRSPPHKAPAGALGVATPVVETLNNLSRVQARQRLRAR